MKTIFSKVDQLARLETQVFLVIQHCFSDKMHIYHSDPELDFPNKSWFDIVSKLGRTCVSDLADSCSVGRRILLQSSRLRRRWQL